MERPAGNRRTVIGEKHRVSPGIVTCFQWRKNIRPRYRISRHLLDFGFGLAGCSYFMSSMEKKAEKEERVSQTECGKCLVILVINRDNKLWFWNLRLCVHVLTKLALRNTIISSINLMNCLEMPQNPNLNSSKSSPRLTEVWVIQTL